MGFPHPIAYGVAGHDYHLVCGHGVGDEVELCNV